MANIGPKKYGIAFNNLKEWVDNNLDIYKVRTELPPKNAQSSSG